MDDPVAASVDRRNQHAREQVSTKILGLGNPRAINPPQDLLGTWNSQEIPQDPACPVREILVPQRIEEERGELDPMTQIWFGKTAHS